METDWVVGHVTAALDKAGVADNTILAFTADNGTAPKARFPELKTRGVDSQYHFSGDKGRIAEGGHRVPPVVRWPGTVKPGSSCKEVVRLNDFIATVADLFDVSLPENAAEDRTSILPLLTGESDSLPERPMAVRHDYGGNFAVRKGKGKLVSGNKPLLFDLEADPKESNDVANDNQEVVKPMADTLTMYPQSGRSRGLSQLR